MTKKRLYEGPTSTADFFISSYIVVSGAQFSLDVFQFFKAVYIHKGSS